MAGIYIDKKGYPRFKNSRVLVHRVIAKAPAGRVVHHKDGNPSNFRRSNLKIMSRSSHSRLHARRRSI